MKYRKVGEDQETDLSHILDEIFVRLDMIEYKLKRNDIKMKSIYDNLREDKALID
tara:strand:- start:104 stop:268 length:165 start_codon:yes stop_codon:yes gene_type:complete